MVQGAAAHEGATTEQTSKVGKNVIVDEILGIDSLRSAAAMGPRARRLGLDLLYFMRGEYRAGIHFDCNW